MVLTAVCALHVDATANPDYRAQDRFFFGLSGGASIAGDARVAGSYETTYWPNDWIGMGTVATLASTGTYDLGAELMVAMPLRWIQPYGGALAGWRTTDDDVALRGYGFAGANAYLSRNLRLFVEVRELPSLTVIGAGRDPLVLVGLRGSPDWFHRSRTITKVDTVWWSTLLSVALWSGATLAR